MKNKELIKKLKRHFKTGYGPKCKDYSWGCAVCEGWRAIEVLEDLLMIGEKNDQTQP